MNIITFTGRLTKDAETKETQQSQQPYVVFSVASNFLFGDKEKTARENGQPATFFYNCMAFGDYFSRVIGNLEKGTQVTVVGDLSMTEYEDKDGNTKVSLNVVPIRVERYFEPSTGQSEKKPWD